MKHNFPCGFLYRNHPIRLNKKEKKCYRRGVIHKLRQCLKGVVTRADFVCEK